MILFTLVLSSIFVGSLACSNTHCKDRALADELLQVDFLPNESELRTLCPKVMRFLECEKDFMECPGQSLNELATSSDKIEAASAKAMLGGIGLVRDVCDEDSSLHSDYVASVSCYREYFNGAAANCRNVIMKPLEDFFDQLYPDVDEDSMSEEMYSERRCLRDAYELACVIDNLGNACGDVAQRTARNSVEILKGVLGAHSCNNLKDAADLKSKFLDFLELDEQKRSSVQGIFDLFKRRR